MKPNHSDLLVLDAVARAQPEAYGNAILAFLNVDVRPNALLNWFPMLRPFRGKSAAFMYVHLDRLEATGFLKSTWSNEVYAERGYRRRRYYWLTPKGYHFAPDKEVARIFAGALAPPEEECPCKP